MQSGAGVQDESEFSDDFAVSGVARRINAILGYMVGSAWTIGLLAVARLAGMTSERQGA